MSGTEQKPPKKPDILPAGTRIGRFLVQRPIASGGMGTVYEALQEHPHRTVAIKVLREGLISPAARRRFEYEAKILARLQHPNIAQVIEVGTHKHSDESREIPFIAMEYVPGALPITRFADAKGLGIRERLSLFLQVCAAVQHAHQRSVIHRDLKPSNILIDDSGQAKVIDFGVARFAGGETLITRGTEGDHLIGTLQYMSPEQCAGDPLGVDIRSDVYTLGVVLFELLSGHLPYDVSARALVEAIRVVQEVDPTMPSTLNEKLRGDLETLLLKALEKERIRRYQSAADLKEDILRHLQGQVILARPAGLRTRIWKFSRRKPKTSIALAIALAAIIGFVGYQVLWFYPQVKAQNAIALRAMDAAIAAREEATESAALSEERLDQVKRLSDAQWLFNLEREAERLWPAYSEMVPSIETWIENAKQIVLRLPLHRRTLEALRDQAGIDGFKGSALQWQIDALADLVDGLEEFSHHDAGLLKEMQDRLALASTVEEQSIDRHRDAWNAAVESIADTSTCPFYDGLRIKPQCGLVPIGRDPQSGFWEFCHLQTGEVPERDEDGRIILEEESGLVLVLLPGGAFSMGAERPSKERPLGSPNVDPWCFPMAGPVHSVTLQPFFLSKYEMTQGQWVRATGENPGFNKDHFGLEQPTPLHPVESVSWNDCAKILPRLKLRLPTEAEWEYGARGGTTTVRWTGHADETLKGAGNFRDVRRVVKEFRPFDYDPWLDDGWIGHAPVGIYLPNQFGLHDVLGNVLEWCRDSYGSYEITYDDGTAFESFNSSRRIMRGGDYKLATRSGNSAARGVQPASRRNGAVGVRPAADLES